jgi:hypothetical protein
VEDMRENENHSKPQDSKNKFTNQVKKLFNSFCVVSPKPNFKPTLESVREGTTAAIIAANTHVNNPLLYFLSILYYNFKPKARTTKRQKVGKNMRMTHPHLNISI